MDLYKLKNFTRGWIIGNFSPAVLETADFEVGLLTHKKNEIWPDHFQKVATEYNVLIYGEMYLDDKLLLPGDIFIIYPGEIAKVQFLQDCQLLVVKVPSLPADKFIV